MPPAPVTPLWDSLWIDTHLATMRADAPTPYGAVENGAIGVKDGRIAWVGAARDLPDGAIERARAVHRLGGAWITPGLVDCHTHVVFAGDRSAEFEMRLHGASYAEISDAGGGIKSTVAHTRAASDETLYTLAAARLGALMAQGVTTVEIKSGYGLDLETEMRLLRVARRIGATLPLTVRTTLLGAHAIPAGVSREAYLDMVCGPLMEGAAREGLADAVDAFCEGIAFTPDETARVFQAAARHKLAVKLHADQLSDSGGAALAARHGALSADHLEYANEAGLDAMATAGTVAVLLPGAYYMLRESRMPPVAAMRARGIAMAVASDCNPGTSPALSLPLVMNMACTLFRLTPEEALAGTTRNAARALGLGAELGQLAPGMAADFAIWGINRPAELAYWLGPVPCLDVIKNGASTRKATGKAVA